jgi:type II secretory pathway predicted ATPase ExeA
MTSLGFFFGVSEGGMSELSALGEHESDAGPTVALKSRISSTTLVAFTLDQTRQLIEKRLQRGRLAAPDQSNPEAYIIPFTDGFVSYVHSVTMGWPRGIVQTCQEVLEAGLAEGAPLLDKDFAERVRSDRA